MGAPSKPAALKPGRAGHPTRQPGRKRKIRYAVIGQGYISQIAMLPAFAHAARNSELAALVSDDPVKLKKLSRIYGVRSMRST